jgi:hypothetical protein
LPTFNIDQKNVAITRNEQFAATLIPTSAHSRLAIPKNQISVYD